MRKKTQERWKKSEETKAGLQVDCLHLETRVSLAKFDKVNQRDHPRGLIIGSTNVVALYPSLDINFTVKKVCDIIRQSPIKFADLWYEEIGLYAAVNST